MIGKSVTTITPRNFMLIFLQNKWIVKLSVVSESESPQEIKIVISI